MNLHVHTFLYFLHLMSQQIWSICYDQIAGSVPGQHSTHDIHILDNYTCEQPRHTHELTRKNPRVYLTRNFYLVAELYFSYYIHVTIYVCSYTHQHVHTILSFVQSTSQQLWSIHHNLITGGVPGQHCTNDIHVRNNYQRVPKAFVSTCVSTYEKPSHNMHVLNTQVLPCNMLYHKYLASICMYTVESGC